MSFSEIWSTGFFLDMIMRMEKDFGFYIAMGLGFFVFAILIPYLCGSINSAVIISRLLYRDDVRNHGSGNAGMTNMLRTYGKGAAGLTLLGDLLKTALAIAVASLTMSSGFGGWIACLFCVLGHIFPVFHHFKGGKGVLCTAVGILILHPPAFLCAFVTFVILVAATRYVSLGSVVAGMLLPLYIDRINSFLLQRAAESGSEEGISFGLGGLISVILALIILWCHRANLGRIMRREENKLSFKKKKKDDEQ